MIAAPALLLAASACALPAPAPAPPLPRHVLTVPLPHAAVASIAPQFPGAVEDPALLLTTFAPVGKDSVVAVPRLSEALRTGAVYPVTLDSDAKWPNQAEFVPAGRAAQLPGPGVLVAGGFFVSPSKSTGAVSLLDLSTLPSHPRKMQLSTDKKGFFYHDAQWLAVEPGSARLDVVAARAQKPLIGKSHSELVWLQQPGPAGGAWTERTLISGGPGVGFALTQLDGGGARATQVVASQFFTAQQLS